MITLDSVSEAQFKTIDLRRLSADNYRFCSLIQHELTHWIDNIATLWGQRNLKMLFNRLNALAMGDEKEFWRIKEMDNLTSADSSNDYYTETYNHLNGSFKEPCKLTYTTGIRYDAFGKLTEENPILFAKFDTLDDIKVKRVLVSIASILETNAIYEEYSEKCTYLSGIKDKRFKFCITPHNSLLCTTSHCSA